MSAQWWIKHHAAERWIERFRPELTVEEASADLARLVSECVEVARAVADGRREYLHPAWPEARFLVNPRVPRGYLPVLVTVLDATPGSQCARMHKGVLRNQRRRFRREDRRDAE